MRFHLTPVLCAVTGLLILSSTAKAAGVNGGFETGDYTGWITSSAGLASVVSSYSSYNPVEGSYLSVLTAGTQDTPTTLTQSFHVNAGATLTGYAFFQANDSYDPFNGYNDDAYVSVSNTVGGVTTTTNLFGSSVGDVGDFGNTPWTAFQYTFGTSGTYTLQEGVTNRGDSALSSVAGLDGVSITDAASVTPEASSFLMFAQGGLLLGVFLRRKSRNKTV